jgi:hypothetical protein
MEALDCGNASEQDGWAGCDTHILEGYGTMAFAGSACER